MSKGWDNLTLKKLKSLVGKGLSTSEIGRRLGLSKNAVVGKLNRLGWNAKAGASDPAKTTTAKAKKTTTTGVKPKTTAKTVAKKVVAKISAKKSTAVKAPAKKAAPADKTVKKTATKVVAKTEVKADKKPVAAKETKEVKETKETAARTSAKSLAMHQRIIQHSLEMANLKPNQCRWPIGDPDSEDFHFCGKTVFTGKPYCYEHCRVAYQFTPPKKK